MPALVRLRRPRVRVLRGEPAPEGWEEQARRALPGRVLRGGRPDRSCPPAKAAISKLLRSSKSEKAVYELRYELTTARLGPQSRSPGSPAADVRGDAMTPRNSTASSRAPPRRTPDRSAAVEGAVVVARCTRPPKSVSRTARRPSRARVHSRRRLRGHDRGRGRCDGTTSWRSTSPRQTFTTADPYRFAPTSPTSTSTLREGSTSRCGRRWGRARARDRRRRRAPSVRAGRGPRAR